VPTAAAGGCMLECWHVYTQLYRVLSRPSHKKGMSRLRANKQRAVTLLSTNTQTSLVVRYLECLPSCHATSCDPKLVCMLPANIFELGKGAQLERA
jgi:hypothetical protein